MEVRQVVNALELLEYFAARGRPASLAEISKHFGWPRSSTFNLLGTLASKGYLYEPQARQGYYPSPKWMPMLRAIEEAAPLPDELRQLVQNVGRRTNETTVLAAISGMQALFIVVQESPQAVRYAAHVGKTVPLHATATGRTLLSQLSPQERATILRRTEFERYTPTSPMSVEAVEREIELSLERGYFIGAAEYTRDLSGYAMPVRGLGRQLALLVGGPLARVSEVREEILAVMREEIGRVVPQAR